MNAIINNFPLEYDAVILAAGNFPHHLLPIKILKQAKLLFVCDGALASLLDLDITPTAIIGDGDSLSPQLKEQYKAIYHHVPEQEENDLTKATRFAIATLQKEKTTKQRYHICYIGATGKREDHTMGNIALLSFYQQQLNISPTMVTDHGYFTATEGEHHFAAMPRQQVSIFNFSCQSLTSEGLKWSIFPMQQLWQGTLNEALSNSFTIQGDGSYLVYQTFEGK